MLVLMVVPVIPARHKNQNELQFQVKRLLHNTHSIKTKKTSPDLFLLKSGMIFLIITEFKLLAIIHFLMETWRTDTGHNDNWWKKHSYVNKESERTPAQPSSQSLSSSSRSFRSSGLIMAGRGARSPGRQIGRVEGRGGTRGKRASLLKSPLWNEKQPFI